MTDWTKNFKREYDYARGYLADNAAFDKDWQALAKKLHKMMDPTGFDAGEAEALTQLRKKVTQGASTMFGHKKVGEDQGLLQAVGAWAEGSTGTVEANPRMRAAALKFLRHVYLLNKSGSRKVWVHSLPIEFTDWPSFHLWNRGTTLGNVKTLLKTSNEIFSEEQKRYLANSTQQAMAWCQKTGIVLAEAAATKQSKKRDAAQELVKRWFAEPGLSATELTRFIDILQRGFKSIMGMLNRGHFVLTDWVPLRGATTADDQGFLFSEAFTFASNHEGMDVVYIERSFFTDDAGGVVHGQKNWTRVVVHELTHLVCGTEDVQNGQSRYAWYGIGPHAGYPGSDAIRNADNWAFFAADCAGVLTDGERTKALKII